MGTLSEIAKPAIAKLMEADENQLYELLGFRAKAIAEDPLKSGYFEPQVTYDQAEMGIRVDVRDFGWRLFNRWNREVYDLVCNTSHKDQEDRKELVRAFGIDDVTVAAALTALLITYLGISPAIATIVATLVAKRFLRPTYDVFCEIWKENLAESDSRN